MPPALVALLHRPTGELVILAAVAAGLLVLAAGVVVVILRALAYLLGKLHVKKIGLGGIECSPEPRPRKK